MITKKELHQQQEYETEATEAIQMKVCSRDENVNRVMEGECSPLLTALCFILAFSHIEPVSCAYCFVPSNTNVSE